MFISKTKTNNTTTYYLCKSYRDFNTGKNTSKTIERIGTHEELKAKLGNKDIDKWLKNYAKEKTLKDKKSKPVYSIPKGESLELKNAGYLYLQNILYKLGIKKICETIKKKEKLNFDILPIITCLIYCKILYPEAKLSISQFSRMLIEEKKFKYENVLKTLKTITKYNTYIQIEINKHVKKIVHSPSEAIYYDSSNITSIINNIADLKNIEASSNGVSLIKTFYDQNAIPVSFVLENTFYREYEKYTKINKYIYGLYKDSKLFVCPNRRESKTDEDLFNSFSEINHLTFQKLEKFDTEIVEWTLDPKGWHLYGTERSINLQTLENKLKYKDVSDVELDQYYGQIFYKKRKFKDSNTGKMFNLIVLFNFELQEWNRTVRTHKIASLQSSIEQNINNEQLINKYKKLLVSDNMGLEDKELRYFNDSLLHKDKQLDGYLALTSHSEDKYNDSAVNAIFTNELQFQYSLMHIRNEYVGIDKLTIDESFTSHCLIAFISLVMFKVLERKLGNKYWNTQIVDTLNSMNYINLKGVGWIPTYENNSLTQDLNNFLGLRYDFLSDKEIKSAIKSSIQSN